MKTFLRFLILPIFIFCFCNATIAQCWKDGDLVSYDQSTWGDPSSTAASNLNKNYNSVYASTFGAVEVGIPGSSGFSMRLASSLAVIDYLPAVGTPGPLNADLFDPLTTPSGSFGGDVLALRLNVDFSDSGFLSGNQNIKFGDLVLYNFSNLPALNGITVRQFLDMVNTLLGGGTGIYSISDLDPITLNITNAFFGGTVSTFAQQHLKKGWKSGDFIIYGQVDWGTGGSGNATLISKYGTVYAGTAGGFEIGYSGGYTALWTNVSILSSYLPASGQAATLTANITNATSTSSGILGGDVAALKLNIDFSDSGFLSASAGFHFGDLVLYGITDLTGLNGMTVRQFLTIANTVLGGGTSTYSVDDIDKVSRELLGAFYYDGTHYGTPSPFAQLHLKRGWQNGDLVTYNQGNWSNTGAASTILVNNYNTVYYSTGGLFDIGSNSGCTNSSYIIQFDGAQAIQSFLPQSGTPNVLTGCLADPQFSSSGSFGGNVAALKLNIDFSDAGLLSGNSGLKFGDLTICGLTSNTDLNEKTVRQFLDIANTALSGASTPYAIADLNAIAASLNISFGTGFNGSIVYSVSTWGQLHLVNGSCDCGNTVTNHCPTASAINISTTVGTAVKFLLQGSDADNNTLTYSISQSPSHGTATIAGGDSIIYTPTTAYHGTDQLKYKVSDGQCSAEATVNVTVVVCPNGQGYWKNNINVWPVSSLMLGINSYTKSQLITILKTAVGTGNNADASLILADQLITTKLDTANGSPASVALSDSIAAADALIGGSLIPMKVKPSSALGNKMTSLANYLANYNSGATTQGCSALTAIAIAQNEEPQVSNDYELEQNSPNPFNAVTTIRYRLPVSSHVTLTVYDVSGRIVRTLIDENENAGIKTIQFNSGQLSAGVYYYRLTADQFSVGVKKMILVK